MLLRNSLFKIAKLVAFIMFPSLVGMFLVADCAIPLILSKKWIPAILPFKILCLISTLRVVSPIDSHLVVAKRRPDISFTNMIICSLVMPLGFLIGSKYGLKGLGYAWLFLYPIVFLIMTKRSINVINLSLLQYFKNLTWPIIATLVMVILVSIFKHILINYDYLTQLICLSTIGALCYVSFVFLFNREVFLEVKSFLRGA